MARPSRYKKEYCKLLESHFKSGFSFDSFGGIVFVSRETLYSWTRKHKEFLDTKKQFETSSLLWWEQMGQHGAAGKLPGFNSGTWIFNMKNRFGWRDRQEIDIGNKDNADFKFAFDLTDAPE